MTRLTGATLAVLLAGVAAAPALGQAPGTSTTPLKLAFINSQLILANTPGRAEAESTFNKEMAGYQAQVQQLQATLDSSVADYNRASLVLSPSAKAQKEQQLRDLQTRTQSQINELQQRANQREQQLTAPIMARVNAVIAGIRAEYNYSIIFDAAANGGGIVQADPALDISQLVIQRLQAGGPPAPLAPVAADSTRPVRPDSAAADSTKPARPRPRPGRP